jgi:hypothetical protein
MLPNRTCPNFIALQIAQCVQQVFRNGGIATADH